MYDTIETLGKKGKFAFFVGHKGMLVFHKLSFDYCI